MSPADQEAALDWAAPYDELQAGQSFVSRGRTITEADVVGFAALTGDWHPQHSDAVWAAGSAFGERIAHGMWGAGLISAVLGTRLPGPGTIYLRQELRFLRPVKIGDTVTATCRVRSVDPVRRRLTLATTCTNQAGEPVIDGEATVLVDAPHP